MPLPYPTAVNTASFRLQAVIENRYGGIRFIWLQFNFITSGTFPVGYTSATFEAHIYPWIFGLIDGIWGGASMPVYAFWLVTTPARNYRMVAGYIPTVAPTWPSRLVNNGLAILLRTARMDRSGVARIHWPFLCDGDNDGSKILPACITRLNQLLTFYTTPMTIDGVTFRSCVWSRKFAEFNPVTSVTTAPNVMYLRKRRGKALKSYDPLVWPVNF